MRIKHAVVALPLPLSGLTLEPMHKRWLSRGRVSVRPASAGSLARVIEVIGAPIPDSGLGALRYWGQTGERPSGWMSAADPVHFETRLRHLLVHAFLQEKVSARDLGEIIDTAQRVLGEANG